MRKWCRGAGSPPSRTSGNQAAVRASPLPGPPVGLVGIRSVQETAIVRSFRRGAGLIQLFAVEDEPPALSLKHDHFALGGVVQDAEPVLPGFRGGDLLHVDNVQ
jgi:hypothetical protein